MQGQPPNLSQLIFEVTTLEKQHTVWTPKLLLRLGIALFLLYLAIHYWAAFSAFALKALRAAKPLVWGCILAYLVNILMVFYERHYGKKASASLLVRKSRRPVCLLLAFVTLFGIAAAIVSLVIPELISALELIVDRILKVVVPLLEHLLENPDFVRFLPEELLEFLNTMDWESRLTQLLSLITEGLGATVIIAADTVFSLISTLVSLLIAVIFSVYVLLSKEKLLCQFGRLCRRYLRPSWNAKLSHVLHVANDCFHRYIVGQCLEAAILGVLCTVGMLLLGLPYAPMIGALIGVTALIPVAGAYIGALVGVFLILTISPVEALVFLVFLVVLQQFEGNIIYPKVVGSSIGLPAIWVLAAITVGGGLSGIVGMLLGVPITSIVYRLIEEDLEQKDACPPQGGACTSPDGPCA